jgi:multidrug efflux pump subunit AcrA (membrane-fusion protein)
MKFFFVSLSLLLPALAAERVVLDAVAEKNLRIETVAAEEGEFVKTLSALGQLEAMPEKRSVLSSRIPGRIIETNLAIGAYVEKGADLVLLESRQPGDPPPSVWLKAPASGTILAVNAVLGSPVEPDDVLCEIADLSTMYAVATVPQQRAGEIVQGTKADLHFPLRPKEKLSATLLKFTPCPCPDPSCALGQNLSSRSEEEHADSNSAGVVFSLKNPDNQLRPSMKAEFSILLNKRANVMSIPRDALQGDGMARFVFIRDYELKHAFVKAPVTIGEINAQRVEILSGLFPGDEVVTRGSYALSFAGKGSVSLKEALDAAHGHPHNEDGTEMTKEQIAAGGHDHDHDHAEGSHASPLVWFLAAACAILFILLILATTVLRKPHNA